MCRSTTVGSLPLSLGTSGYSDLERQGEFVNNFHHRYRMYLVQAVLHTYVKK